MLPYALLAAAAIVGCGGSVLPASEVVKVRASREFECPETKVTVSELGGRAYRAKACGTTQIYVCNHEETDAWGSLDSIVCAHEGTTLPAEEPNTTPVYVPVPVPR